MSTNIDDRIVQMEFNNRQFEKNIEQSSKSLEKFNEQLKFKDAKRGVRDLEATVNAMNLSSLASAVDSLENHFTSAFERLKTRVVDRFLDNMASKVSEFIKRMTITPISSGWKKYEENTQSVQTIMAATGKSIEDVQEQMAKLMWFTDETSYGFTDMTSNIGKFTGAGVELETAVTAMQGIALWAALSGQNAQGASRAMYNLSQAIGMGAVTAIDWKSIQTANMDTIEFKQHVIDAAKALGKLNKQGKTMKGTLVTAENFYGSLSEKWFTTDVLLKVLQEYGEFADLMYEETKHGAIPASEAMAKYSSSVKTLGERAFRAGQEAKTLTDALGSVDDATSTSWMKTWELVFGNYEEAKVLFTDLANMLWEIFNAGNAIRNEALQIWHDLDKNENGRIDALQAIYDILDSIGYAAGKAREAIDEIIPSDVDAHLKVFTSISAGMVEAANTIRELLGYEEEFVTRQGRNAVVEPFDEALKRGAKGEGVKDMQRRLEALGYSVGKAGIDGIFGPDTEAALKKFQQESGLLDKKRLTLGLYDEQTQVALIAAGMGEITMQGKTITETVEHAGTQTKRIANIAKGIASIFSLIGKVLNFGWGVVKLIAKTLAPVGNGLLIIISAIASSFTNLNNTLSGDNVFSKWLEDIETKLSPVKAKIEEITNSVLAFFGLTPKLDENGEAISNESEELMTFSKLWENIRTNLEESGALDRLTEAFENLKASIENIKASIKSWWASLTETLGKKATEGLTSLWDALPGVATTLVNALTSVINWLSEKAGKIPDTISSIVGWFTNLYNTLKESETIKAVGVRLRNAFDSIKRAFQSIAPSASKWLENLRILLFGSKDEEKKGLTDKLQDALPGIIERVGNALASALEFFSQVIENIPDNVDKIKTFFTDLYEDLKESEKVQSIIGTVESVFESIGGVLAKIWNAIVSFLTGNGTTDSTGKKATRRGTSRRHRTPIEEEVSTVESTMESVSNTASTIDSTVNTISETIDSVSTTVNDTLETVDGVIESVSGTIETVKSSVEGFDGSLESIYGIVENMVPQLEGTDSAASMAYGMIGEYLGISTDAETAAKGIDSAITSISSALMSAGDTIDATLNENSISEALAVFNEDLGSTNGEASEAGEKLADTRTFLEKVGDGFKGILDALAPWAIGTGFTVGYLSTLRTVRKVPKSLNEMLETIALIKFGPKAIQPESKTSKFIKIAGGIALLAGSIYLVAKSILVLGTMDAEQLKRGGIAVGVIVSVLGLLSAGIGALGKKTEFGKLSTIASGVGGAILAVLGIVAAIWLVSKINDKDLIRGGVVIGAIITVLLILTVLSNVTTKKGNGIQASIKGIEGLSLVILALVASMWLIGHMRIAVIAKGIIGLVAIAVALKIFLKSMNSSAEGMAKAKWGWIIALVILIGQLTRTIKTLGNMETEPLIKGILGLGAVLFAASKTLKSVSNSNATGGRGIWQSIMLITIIAALVWAITTIGKMDTSKILAAGGVLTAVIGFSALLTRNVSKLNVGKGNWTGLISMLGSLVLIGGIMWSFYAIVQGLESVNTHTITAVGNALKGVMFMASWIVSAANHPGKNANASDWGIKSAVKSFLSLISVFAAIGLVVTAIGLLSNSQWFTDNTMKAAKSIGEFMGTIAGYFLAAKIKSFATGINTYAEEMNGVNDPGDSLLEKTQWAIKIGEAIHKFEETLSTIGGEDAVSIKGAAISVLEGWGLFVFGKAIGSFGEGFRTFIDVMSNVPSDTMDESKRKELDDKIDYAIKVATIIHDFEILLTDANKDGRVTIGDVASTLLTNWAAGAAWGNIQNFAPNFNEFASSMEQIDTKYLTSDMEDKVATAVSIAGYIADFEDRLRGEGITGAIGALIGQWAFGQFNKNLGTFGLSFNVFAANLAMLKSTNLTDTELEDKTDLAVKIAQKIVKLANALNGEGKGLEGALSGWITQFSFGHFIENLGKFGETFPKYVEELTKFGEAQTGENGDKLEDMFDQQKFEDRNALAMSVAGGIAELAKTVSDSADAFQAWGKKIDQGNFNKFIDNIPRFGEAMIDYANVINELFAKDYVIFEGELAAVRPGEEEFQSEKERFEKVHAMVIDTLKAFVGIFDDSSTPDAMGFKMSAKAKMFDEVVKFMGNDKQRGGLLTYVEAVKNFGGTDDVTAQTGYIHTILSSFASFVGDITNLDIVMSSGSGKNRIVGTTEKFSTVVGALASISTTISNNKDTIRELSSDSALGKGLENAVTQISTLATSMAGVTGITDFGSATFVNALERGITLIGTLGSAISVYQDYTSDVTEEQMQAATDTMTRAYNAISESVLATSTEVVTQIRAANSEAIGAMAELFGMIEGSETKETAKTAGSTLASDFTGSLSEGISAWDGKSKALVAINNLMNSVKTAAFAYFPQFKTAGRNYTLGLSLGMLDSGAVAGAVNAANLVAARIVTATKKALRTESPSKVGEEIGMYFDMGLANGLTNSVGIVTMAASDVSEEAVKASNDIFSAVTKALSEGIDYDPVIRPVLDLTNIRSGANTMHSMFGNRTIGVASTDMATRIRTNANYIPVGSRNNVNLSDSIQSVNDRLDNLGEAVTNMKIVLDSGVVAGQIAPKIDKHLGRAISLKGRG